MRKLDIGPRGVAFEIRRPDEERRRVIRGSGWVNGAIERRSEGGIVYGIVLGVAADSNIRLRADYVANVLKELVGELVGIGFVA